VYKEIYHEYSDKEMFLGAKVLCYSFEEVFAEKFRALIQRARPRDLFDVIKLFELKRDIVLSSFAKTITEKFKTKSVLIPAFSVFEQTPFKAELLKNWVAMLGHQISNLEDGTTFWNKLRPVFSWIHEQVLPHAKND
jgi:predicted nucleotidyltransferase component of viral defense system